VDGATTVFHYDLDGKLIAESLPDGTTTAEYLYMGKIRIAKVDVSTDNIYYYLNDRLGTPQIMTDHIGTVAWEASYRPFGEASVNPKSSVVNNLRFPGQYCDQETGLHYNYFRDYCPRIGRYLEPDPLNAGSIVLLRQALKTRDFFDELPQTALGYANDIINLYPYVLNNPVNRIDTYGLFEWITFGYGAFEVSVGIQSVAAGFGIILGTGTIGTPVGVLAVYEGFFLVGVGLTDVIGAFYDKEPLVSMLPKEIEIFGRKLPFGSLIYPLPPEILRKKKGDSCEK